MAKKSSDEAMMMQCVTFVSPDYVWHEVRRCAKYWDRVDTGQEDTVNIQINYSKSLQAIFPPSPKYNRLSPQSALREIQTFNTLLQI